MAGTDPDADTPGTAGVERTGADTDEPAESSEDGELAFRDRAVYLPAADALVVADLHVGRDATSNVEASLGERVDLPDRLGGLVDRFSPAEVVVAGDLLHAFDSVPDGAGETLAALRATAEDAGADFLAVRGNHDTMLPSAYDGEVHEAYRLDDGSVVAHGHEEPAITPGGEGPPVERYLVGHDHPAIEIEGRRRACFLLGTGAYRRTDVLVLPAFNPLAAGTVVNGADGRDLLSPLVTNLDAFRPIVRDRAADETLWFPPLGRFRRLL